MAGELQAPLWGWSIVLYFFVGGVAGGAYFLATVIQLVGSEEDRPVARLGFYLAFPLSLVCAILLMIDLGRPELFWHMVVYSPTLLPWPSWDAPMSVGAYALLFFGVFSFLSFADALVETRRWPWAPFCDRYSGVPCLIYSCVGALFGFFLTAYTGELLSTTQIPSWGSNPFLGALFAASGASTGVAAVTLALIATRTDVRSGWHRLKRVDTVAMIFEVLLLAAFLLALGTVASQLLSGLSGLLLVGGVVVLGLLVPLALQLRSGSRIPANLATLTSALVLVGGFLLRAAVVMGGQGLL